MSELAKKLKISINSELTFQNRNAQALRQFAEQLRSGAEIPPAGRALLADILEGLAAGKTLKAEVTKRGRKTQVEKLVDRRRLYGSPHAGREGRRCTSGYEVSLASLGVHGS